MLSPLLYTMLKLSKTTSAQKLFLSDCMTLYLEDEALSDGEGADEEVVLLDVPRQGR